MNKIKLKLLFPVLFFLTNILLANDSTSCLRIIRQINDSVEDFVISDSITQDKLESTITDLRQFANLSIKLVERSEFEILQQKTAQTAGYMVALSEKIQSQSIFLSSYFDLYHIYFNLIVEAQKGMQSTFDSFDVDARLENMLPFIQSRNALHHAKISLLDMTALSHNHITSADDKNIYAKTSLYLLDHFDYKELERDPDINMDHSIIILQKLVDTIDLFQHQYTSSLEPDKNSNRYLAKLNKMHKEYNKRLQVAIDKNARLEAEAHSAKSIKVNDRILKFEELYTIYNAAAYFQMGCDESNVDIKINHFTEAIRQKPDFLEAYINRGICYHDAGEHLKAIQDFDHALFIDPLHKVAWYNLGIAHMSIEDFKSAIHDFDRVLQIDPNHKSACLNTGASYQKLQEYDKAIQFYSRAILIDSHYTTAIKNRALLYQALKKFEKAIDDYEAIIALAPKDWTAYYNLGIIYYDLREWQKVVEYWEQCLVLQPEQPFILDYLPIAKNELKKRQTK